MAPNHCAHTKQMHPITTVAVSLLVVRLIVGASTHTAFGPADGRIVGGHAARPHSAPWLVSMQWGPTTVLTTHMCAGSIIRPHWVLTAAHCLDAVPALGTWLLIAGRHNIRANAEPAGEQRRPVVRRQTWRHPLSTVGRAAPFDIALIRVERAFDVHQHRSARVAVIALPAADRIDGGLADLHGWGSTSTTSAPVRPAELQTAAKPIVRWTDCDRALGGASPLHATNMCTGPLTGGRSACSGDSGGSLTQNGTVLLGVVSWGRLPCGGAMAPTVYVRVSAFSDWIAAVVQRN